MTASLIPARTEVSVPTKSTTSAAAVYQDILERTAVKVGYTAAPNFMQLKSYKDKFLVLFKFSQPKIFTITLISAFVSTFQRTCKYFYHDVQFDYRH